MCWVNDILAKLKECEEFHHLYDDLKKDEKSSLITIETIEKISNFRETISPEERLSVTLREIETK
nr:unnamed protein product [Callosobruchus chinensis]